MGSADFTQEGRLPTTEASGHLPPFVIHQRTVGHQPQARLVEFVGLSTQHVTIEVLRALDEQRVDEEFVALPAEQLTVDIQCVTKWSELDTSWRGVARFAAGQRRDRGEYLTAWYDGGYTTNLAQVDDRRER